MMEAEGYLGEGDQVERPPGPGPGGHDPSFPPPPPEPAPPPYQVLPEPDHSYQLHRDGAGPYQPGPQPYQPLLGRGPAQGGYMFTAPPSRPPTNSFIGITPPALPAMLDYQAEQSSSFTQTFLRGIKQRGPMVQQEGHSSHQLPEEVLEPRL